TDRIADFQASYGWEPNSAFKRRTAYYDGFYKETVGGKEITVLSSNRNNNSSGAYYMDGDNNNKYVPYFHKNYMTSRGLSAYDYNYFYPNQSYSGFNVMGGDVVTPDIVAENGVIHEVSEVSLPLQNLDQYLSGDPKYSLFKSLF